GGAQAPVAGLVSVVQPPVPSFERVSVVAHPRGDAEIGARPQRCLDEWTGGEHVLELVDQERAFDGPTARYRSSFVFVLLSIVPLVVDVETGRPLQRKPADPRFSAVLGSHPRRSSSEGDDLEGDRVPVVPPDAPSEAALLVPAADPVNGLD